MEPNQRDTPLRRFSTFCWGLGLFVVFAIFAFVIKGCVFTQETDVDDQVGQDRLIKLSENTAAQKAAVKVDPTTLFSKAAGTLDFTPADSGQPHNKQFEAK